MANVDVIYWGPGESSDTTYWKESIADELLATKKRLLSIVKEHPSYQPKDRSDCEQLIHNYLDGLESELRFVAEECDERNKP